MSRIILKNQKYSLYDFENEAEFEKAVIENKEHLFGKDTIYIDIKRRIGRSNHRGIPDAFLIDFYDTKNPQLYIIENELASHNVYSNIAEQIARFSASAISSQNQIRNILSKTIEETPLVKKELEKRLVQTVFKTPLELLVHLVEKEIKIVIVINEISADLSLALKVFRSPPDVVLLQRYQNGNNTLYYYEPMREEIEEAQFIRGRSGKVKFDTIVCAAYEDGFKHAYIQNNAWWEVRLSQEAREKLKYLAIYEKAPVAHIKHYAEIDKIEPYKDTGKFILYLKNKKMLPKPIPLGKRKGEAPQSPRYSTLDKLLRAKAVGDLWG
jgi:hypothetical protein